MRPAILRAVINKLIAHKNKSLGKVEPKTPKSISVWGHLFERFAVADLGAR